MALQLAHAACGSIDSQQYGVATGIVGASCRFLAYVSSTSVVVLDGNLRRLQVLDLASQAPLCCICACPQNGVMAAASGQRVHILAPFTDASDVSFPYRWRSEHSFTVHGDVTQMAWSRVGDFLIVGSDELALWRFQGMGDFSPVCAWTTSISAPIYHLRIAPDDCMFACAGQADKLLKVWFPTRRTTVDDTDAAGTVDFDFVYLPHPKPMTSCSWRQVPESTGAGRHAAFTANVLLTSCEDGICRLWSETGQDEVLAFYITGYIALRDYSQIPACPGVPFRLHWLNTHELRQKLHAVGGERDSKQDPSVLDPRSRANRLSAAAAEPMPSPIASLEDASDVSAEITPTVSSPGAVHVPRWQTSKHSAASWRSRDSTSPRIFQPGAASLASQGTGSWPEMVFFIHPDGSLVFWYIHQLNSSPRREARIQLASWTISNVIPQREAINLLDVLVYASPHLDLWCRHPDVEDKRHVFEYHVPRQLPLDLVCLLRDGSLTKWRALFTVRSSFSTVSRVDHNGSMSGHRKPVVRLLPHPTLPYMTSVGMDSIGTEVLVWALEPESSLGLHCTNSLQLLARYVLPYACEPNELNLSWLPSTTSVEMLIATSEHLLLVSVTQADPSQPVRLHEIYLDAQLPAHCRPSTLQLHSWSASLSDTLRVLLVDASQGLLHVWSLALAVRTGPSADNDAFSSLLQAARHVVLASTEATCSPKPITMEVPLGLPKVGHGLLTSRTVVTHSALLVGLPPAAGSGAVYAAFGCSDSWVRFWHISGDGVHLERCDQLDIAPPKQPAPAIHLLQATSSNRLLVCWAPVDVGGLGVTHIYECESDPSRFRIEFVVDLSDTVLAASWCDHALGSLMLAVVTEHALHVYSQLASSFCGGWTRLLQFDLTGLPTGHRTVSWVAHGNLAVGAGRELFLFSRWLDKPSAPAQDSIFKQAEYVNGSLPHYHPDMLFDMLLAGKFDQAELTLQHLLASCRRTHHDNAAKIHVAPLLISELLDVAVAPDGGPGRQQTQNSGDYDMLFASAGGRQAPDDDQNVAVAGSGLAQLGEELMRRKVPGLDRIEQVKLLALIEAYADIKAHREALDSCGVRFFVAERMCAFLHKAVPPGHARTMLQSSDFAWAFHSESQEGLVALSSVVLNHPSAFGWPDLQALGFGFWVRRVETLRTYLERIAKNSFQQNQDPLAVALFYLALRKKNVLVGLFKVVQDTRMVAFFGNDFSQERWQTAALKNAYALMGKRRFMEAAAFFLLGNQLTDAIGLCLDSMHDPQLAIVLTRVYAPDEQGFQELLAHHLLPWAQERHDLFLQSIMHWQLRAHLQALRVLIQQESLELLESRTGLSSLLNLSRYLQRHVQVAGHGCPPALAQNVPSHLYFRTAYSYAQRGAPLLALDTLRQFSEAVREWHRNNPHFADGGQGHDGAVISQESRAKKKDMAVLISSGTFDFDFGDDQFGNTAPSYVPVALHQQKKSTADMINSSTFDFDFGGGGGDGSHFGNNSAEVTEIEQPEPAGIMPSGSTISEALQEPKVPPLVESWELRLSMRLICDSLKFEAETPVWATFLSCLQSETSAVLKLCSPVVHETPAASNDSAAVTVVNIAEALAQFYALHEEPSQQCKLLGLFAPTQLVPLLSRMAKEQGDYVVRVLMSSDGKKMQPSAAGTLGRVRQLVEHLSDCVYQITLNATSLLELPTPVQLVEWVGAMYAALFTVAWLERDTGRLLQLLTNPPGPRLWQHLYPGASSATNLLALLRRPAGGPAATAAKAIDAHSVLSFMLQPVSAHVYADVDVLASAENGDRADDDLTSTTNSSDDTADSAYRWALLKLSTAQLGTMLFRDLLSSVGLEEQEELSQTSPLLHGLLAAMEQRVALLQGRLETLPTPAEVAYPPMRSSTAGGVTHPAQSLFKIRSLMDAKANKFASLHDRRLWYFLVRRESLQATIELYMFDSPSSFGQVRSTETPITPPANSGAEVLYKAPFELSALSCNTVDPDALVAGGARGIVELWLPGGRASEEQLERLPSRLGGLSQSSRKQAAPVATKRMTNRGTGAAAAAAAETVGLVQAEVVLQRVTDFSVRVLRVHPTMPCYLSGGADGSVHLWHFGQEMKLCTLQAAGKPRVTGLRFEPHGDKFAVTDFAGMVTLWRITPGEEGFNKPLVHFRAHSKRADAVEFLGSASLIVTGGLSADGLNVSVWDVLVSSDNPVKSFRCCEGGCRSLAFAPSSRRLVCGGHKGEICVIDLRQWAIVKKWIGHESNISAVQVDERNGLFFTSSGSGDMTVWSLESLQRLRVCPDVHVRSSFGRGGTTGMTYSESTGALFSCGADGLLCQLRLTKL